VIQENKTLDEAGTTSRANLVMLRSSNLANRNIAMTDMVFADREKLNDEVHQAHFDSRRAKPFTRVPAPYIGMITNGDKTAAPALHLLAYKLGRGSHFVLNVIDTTRRLAIGKHCFERGLRHLILSGVLHRSQPNHRDYAVEHLSAVPEGCFCVAIDDQIIFSTSSAVVAFILTANVSPTPRTPAEIGERLGIKSPDAIRKVRDKCKELGAVEVFEDDNGKVWVCRPGESPKQGGAKNRGAKNQVAKNRGAQGNKKEDHIKGKKDKKLERHQVVADATPHSDLDILSLSDWRWNETVENITSRSFVDLWVEPPVVSATRIAALIDRHGAPAPAHLLTPHGVHQICTLAAVALQYGDGDEADFEVALNGVCNAIARAINDKRKIRNLAFIAIPILNAAHNGDDWATHYPSHRLGQHQDAWLAWAETRLIPALNSAGVATDDCNLTSTVQLEKLAEMKHRYGQREIERACSKASLASDWRMAGWGLLEDKGWICPQVGGPGRSRS